MRVRLQFSAALLGAAFAALTPSPAARAMSVTSIVSDMTTTGATSRGHLVVFNDNATLLPVEVAVSKISLDENGDFASEPAGDELLIFPSRALVPPGAKQTFRVRWVGNSQIKSSQSYILSVNQVPKKMPKWQCGVQMVLNFATLINVDPIAGKSTLNLLKSGVVNDDKGKPRPMLTVQNPGNIHAKLTDATITLSGGGWSKTLTPEELRRSMGFGLVQPGKTRRFLLPIDMPPNVNDVTASIKYKPTK